MYPIPSHRRRNRRPPPGCLIRTFDPAAFETGFLRLARTAQSEDTEPERREDDRYQRDKAPG